MTAQADAAALDALTLPAIQGTYIRHRSDNRSLLVTVHRLRRVEIAVDDYPAELHGGALTEVDYRAGYLRVSSVEGDIITLARRDGRGVTRTGKAVGRLDGDIIVHVRAT